MSKISNTEIRVRFVDCDFYQHVNNTVYLNYLDIGLAEFLREISGLKNLKKLDYAIHLVHAEIDYKSAATFDDILNVETKIHKLGNTSMTLEHKITCKNTERLIVSAKKVFVFLDAYTQEKIPVPQNIKKFK